MLPGMRLVTPGVLDLAVRKRLPCLLGFPRRAPTPPVPIDFMEAKAVSLNVLQTHAQSAVLVDGLFGCSHSTACHHHVFQRKQTNRLVAVCFIHLVLYLLEAYLHVLLSSEGHHFHTDEQGHQRTATCSHDALRIHHIVWEG